MAVAAPAATAKLPDTTAAATEHSVEAARSTAARVAAEGRCAGAECQPGSSVTAASAAPVDGEAAAAAGGAEREDAQPSAALQAEPARPGCADGEGAVGTGGRERTGSQDQAEAGEGPCAGSKRPRASGEQGGCELQQEQQPPVPLAAEQGSLAGAQSQAPVRPLGQQQQAQGQQAQGQQPRKRLQLAKKPVQP